MYVISKRHKNILNCKTYEAVIDYDSVGNIIMITYLMQAGTHKKNNLNWIFNLTFSDNMWLVYVILARLKQKLFKSRLQDNYKPDKLKLRDLYNIIILTTCLMLTEKK